MYQNIWWIYISDINLNDSSVNISVLDKLSKFDDIYRPRSGHVIFNTYTVSRC